MKNVILYGLSEADKMYKAVGYFCVFDPEATICDINNIAKDMRDTNPSIEHVYMISNRYNLKREYTRSILKPSIEACAIFKDILEREGIMVI
jgi:hypothetical protein